MRRRVLYNIGAHYKINYVIIMLLSSGYQYFEANVQYYLLGI